MNAPDTSEYIYDRAPRNVYWETTIACDLACRHCRAEAVPEADPDELTFAEACALVDEVKRMGSLLVLTGGDPMKRSDLFDIMAYAREVDQPVAITPSTTPTLTRQVVARFHDLGVTAMGLSLDGPTAQVHDAFRGVPGTFAISRRALAWAKEMGIPVQINTTVCTQTLQHVPELRDVLAGFTPPIVRWSLFVLVPTGRGSALTAPSALELEELFEWVYSESASAPFHISTVEAPHYRRFWIQSQLEKGASWQEVKPRARRLGLGMRDGNGVIFVARNGNVYPAGFLPEPLLGNVKRQPLSELYRSHPGLVALRNMENLMGKCGACEFKWPCGGSRARAFAASGDPLGEEPLCVHQPGTTSLSLLV